VGVRRGPGGRPRVRAVATLRWQFRDAALDRRRVLAPAAPVLTCPSMIKVRVVGDISEADLAEVRDLLCAVTRFDDHQALGDHKWLDLVRGGRPRFTGFIAEDPPHPHPVGYAHLSVEGDGPPPHSAASPVPPAAIWGLAVVVYHEPRGIGVRVAF